MERREIDIPIALEIEMTTPEVAIGVADRERRRHGGRIEGVRVVNHRAPPARVVEQALGDPKLQHALTGRYSRCGFGERVPRAKPHAM